MNFKQKMVLWIGVIAIVWMGIVPPWQAVSKFPESNIKRVQAIGHNPIFEPPSQHGAGVTIDLTRLLIQWAITVLITAAWIYSIKPERPKK